MPRPTKKIKLTWAELRQQRNALARFELYIPTLQLKQQQLQSAILQARREHHQAKQAADACTEKISTYWTVFNNTAGVNVAALSAPEDIKTTTANIAGVRVPVFESAAFPQATYSLFGTSPWVDQALVDLQQQNIRLVELEILERKLELLDTELRKVTQRVNLFDKVIIPQTRENIRRIRIALGDRMIAAVARAKIAKEKLEEREPKGKLEVASA
ncbi:MAG: V-type ATP synthase subunit D [Desulfobacteraceae bacterium]|jgi:V/A-type H+-transporting ATPase subunit D|nr:V-type ATP synthase subunit D [Desulfobacteraceae bacterium]